VDNSKEASIQNVKGINSCVHFYPRRSTFNAECAKTNGNFKRAREVAEFVLGGRMSEEKRRTLENLLFRTKMILLELCCSLFLTVLVSFL
jgi:hypothetical protein